MELADLNEEEDLTAAQKREPRHKKPRDKWSLKEENIQESCSRYNHDNGERTGCPETPKDIAIRKPDITETVHYDNDNQIIEAVVSSRSSGTKATNEEPDDNDEYWETMTHIDEEEVIRDDDSDEEFFWESPTEPEEISKTDTLATYKDDKKENIPMANKANKKMFKLRRDFLTKVILFSIVIGRCATAKGIEGLTIENKIEKGNLPDGYFVEQSSTKMIREKIDEEII